MYRIKADGTVIYEPGNDALAGLQAPALQLEMNAPGSLTFTLLPGHPAHETIRKMKTVITVEEDGKEIFRGRALEEKTDLYQQKEIYCEGDLSFLMDSVQRPGAYKGKLRGFLQKLVDSHNSQVEAEKRFSLGTLTALQDRELDLEADSYQDTYSALRDVLDGQEGSLRVRTAEGVHYLDFLSRYDVNQGQKIALGVNLIEVDNQLSAHDLCTVMIPLGATLDDGRTLTIAPVNGGKDFIENAEGIKKYGRITKAVPFDQVTDAAELLRKAREKLNGMEEGKSLTLTAVDMHLLDGSLAMLLPGAPVGLRIDGGSEREDLCTAATLCLDAPEKNQYTFGKPAQTQSGAYGMMTNTIRSHSRLIREQYKHYKETDYTVSLHTGLLNAHDEYISQAKIELDGINATILLKADKTVVDELGKRVSSAEIAIDGANATIALKVSKNDVVSAINMSPEAIKIKASKIELDGYVKASELETTVLDVIERANINSISANYVTAGNGDFDAMACGTLVLGGTEVQSATLRGVVLSDALKSTGKAITFKNANNENETVYVVTSVGIANTGTKNITYLHN